MSPKNPGSRRPLPRRKRGIKPVSDRKRAERDERRQVVAEAIARDRKRGGCQARRLGAPGACSTDVTIEMDPHEIIPRSAWRDGYLVLDNVLMVCRAHHRWIDANAGDGGPAHLLGLHGFSWERPE